MGGGLERFRDGEGEAPLPVALLVLDEGLVRAVQDRLAHHGLLDPPADGFLGPVANGRSTPSAAPAACPSTAP
jgi:hypothetical protein